MNDFKIVMEEKEMYLKQKKSVSSCMPNMKQGKYET